LEQHQFIVDISQVICPPFELEQLFFDIASVYVINVLVHNVTSSGLLIKIYFDNQNDCNTKNGISSPRRRGHNVESSGWKVVDDVAPYERGHETFKKQEQKASSARHFSHGSSAFFEGRAQLGDGWMLHRVHASALRLKVCHVLSYQRLRGFGHYLRKS
jgi:hypothetical protein